MSKKSGRAKATAARENSTGVDVRAGGAPAVSSLADTGRSGATLAERDASVETLSARAQLVGAKIDRLQDDDSSNDPHAFVIMPFGRKPGPDGKPIDFDAVYERLIRPALSGSGFEPFRADEETVSGDILTDMFQELLLADLVVVDMSIDDANVFYELGVRHSFGKRGIVHIQSGRAYTPFDVFNVRTIPYHIDETGVPDARHLERDVQNLVRVTRDTWASDSEAVHSPIFGLLTGLDEPDRRALRTPLATGFWREFNVWEERVAVARRQKRVGDILLLTDEISNPLCREDAIGQAGLALREMGRHELALQEYRKGLAVNANNVDFRREEAVLLERMGRVDEAIIKLEGLLVDEPRDTKAKSRLGLIYTAIWAECWRGIDDVEARRRAAFDAYQWAIKSIDTYLRSFGTDRNTLEPGVKALTLCSVLVELADRHDDGGEPDADIERLRELLPDLHSTLRFSLEADARLAAADYWTWSSLGNCHVSLGHSTLAVARAYRKALSYARKNVFHLRSTLKQLEMFRELGVHAPCADIGWRIVSDEIARIESGGAQLDEHEYPSPETPVMSILFSGHALDRAGVDEERFPADLEDQVRRQIDLALDRAGADANDHGFVPGAACGGDIVFIEACLERGMKVHVHLPCGEARYLGDNVVHGGDSWTERFYAIRNDPRVNIYYQEERVGHAKPGVDPYERNVRWTLYASLVLGIDKLRLVALWDGREGDADGTRVADMVRLAQQMGGIVDHLDITKLDYLFSHGVRDGELDAGSSLGLEARVELLRQVALFAPLHAVDLTQIALVAEERRFADGTTLAVQGEPGGDLFIIVEGEVSVGVACNGSGARELARRCAGECVGETAVIRDEPRMNSLVAVGEVFTLVLSRINFRKIVRSRRETGLAVTRMLAHRLAEAIGQDSIVDAEIANLGRRPGIGATRAGAGRAAVVEPWRAGGAR